MPAPPKIFAATAAGGGSSRFMSRKTLPALPMFTAPGMWPAR